MEYAGHALGDRLGAFGEDKDWSTECVRVLVKGQRLSRSLLL